jgi:hypothetical protein
MLKNHLNIGGKENLMFAGRQLQWPLTVQKWSQLKVEPTTDFASYWSNISDNKR